MNNRQMTEWYKKAGAEGDVVISTRVRLARNLKQYPFPSRLSAEQKKQIVEEVKSAVLDNPSALAGRFRFVDMERLSDIEAVSLVERHLVSPEFISDREGRGLLLLDDESVSIMINEEDHIRMQVMGEGLSLEVLYDMAAKLDTLMDERLTFAFDETLGYLTQCPTNLGTGMRASVMLHLPALQENGSVPRIAGGLSKIGLTIRGLYGENSEPKGALYQLSNQVTLGLSEEAALENLKGITMQLVGQERTAREALLKNVQIEDSIWRSLGILKNARRLESGEFMALVSRLRLGVSNGLIGDLSLDQLNQLMVEAQPATLMELSDRPCSPEERDVLRAERVRTLLQNV